MWCGDVRPNHSIHCPRYAVELLRNITNVTRDGARRAGTAYDGSVPTKRVSTTEMRVRANLTGCTSVVEARPVAGLSSCPADIGL